MCLHFTWRALILTKSACQSSYTIGVGADKLGKSDRHCLTDREGVCKATEFESTEFIAKAQVFGLTQTKSKILTSLPETKGAANLAMKLSSSASPAVVRSGAAVGVAIPARR